MTTDTTHLPAYERERQKVRTMILDLHRDDDGQLDRAALVARAIETRREVEHLEDIVNRGDVSQDVRDELTQAQWWDLHYRATVAAEIPQWNAAVANARTSYSKTMGKAARSLGLGE